MVLSHLKWLLLLGVAHGQLREVRRRLANHDSIGPNDPSKPRNDPPTFQSTEINPQHPHSHKILFNIETNNVRSKTNSDDASFWGRQLQQGSLPTQSPTPVLVTSSPSSLPSAAPTRMGASPTDTPAPSSLITQAPTISIAPTSSPQPTTPIPDCTSFPCGFGNLGVNICFRFADGRETTICAPLSIVEDIFNLSPAATCGMCPVSSTTSPIDFECTAMCDDDTGSIMCLDGENICVPLPFNGDMLEVSDCGPCPTSAPSD